MRAAIDTSSSHAAFVVVADGDSIPLVHLVGIPLGRQSGSLPQQVTSALSDHSIGINEIRQWTVGMGPGSFTGIRVGAALVKGICAGNGASYRGIPSSLAMVMAAAPPSAKTALALHDGRRSEVLVSPYTNSTDGWIQSAAPYPLKIAELGDRTVDCIAILKTDRALQEAQAVRSDLTVLNDFPIRELAVCQPDFNPLSIADQEASCSPVYVRPAVFVEPTLKKQPKNPSGDDA